ncbi:hypothetical protein DAPPUDRAFT_114690 [Daphnia pulex]|uniref:CUB domain-containing protein n=1 Tax=Daphnia pulex TaxID=6669 RepID=E9HIY9_DAPPU|nr:hypothetical protein DAPPUDRAFT_114690 [Daphnia pulex]|eukprot:EFX68305.1 hypothetical protein DAPPUDRAFT_114690 [Daphnia pulex]
MKFFPIVFFLLVVAAAEVRDGICNYQQTPTTKLVARRTWPSQIANTTTTTTAKPTTVTTTVTTTSSSTTSTAQPSTVSTTRPTTTNSTTTATTPLPINVDCSVYNPGCGAVCTNATSAGTGVVQSRNFPGDYGKDNIDCFVTITVPEGKRIRLEFTTFNLETKIGWITVTDGITMYVISATGSTIPPAFTTTSNRVNISFSTYGSKKPDSATFNWQATYAAV